MKRLVVAFALMTLATAAHAQGQRPADLKARVEALEKQVAELGQAAAQAGTASAAVQELATRIAALEQTIDALGRAQQNHTELVARGDELERRVAAAEAEVNALAARLGDIEQPTVATGGGVSRDGGFVLASPDGRYALTIGGYVQPRLETRVAEGFGTIDQSTFRLRRTRLVLSGRIGERLTYKLMPELGGGSTSLQDGYVDYAVVPALAIRAGQAKVPFTREWITSSTRLMFLERPAGLDNLRYDRDLGVWARGELGQRASWVVGLSNGAARNAVNDNIDFVAVARIEGAALGDRFDGHGDLERSAEPRLMVGAGAAHDLVRLPDNIAGIELGQRDVDRDGVVDNVRVVSFSADLAFRFRGFELAVEGYGRHERWGRILDHSGNSALADAVRADADGHRNYLGGYVGASYVPAPGWLLIGARLAHTRLALLGLSGQPIRRPLTDRLLELDLSLQLIQDGDRTLGLGYTLADFSARGVDPAGDTSHRFIVEYQYRL
jgi:hypothetical protein